MRLLCSLLLIVVCGCAKSNPVSQQVDGPDDGLISWIDTHTHPTGMEGDCFTESCLDEAIVRMDAVGMRRALLMSPPAPSSSASREASIAAAAALRPDRFSYSGGGAELNGLLHQDASEATIQAAAQAVVDAGAVGFGETAALHLSYEAGHAFEEISPNSDMFRALVDVAAAADLPIDLHMDSIEHTKSTPPFYTKRSENNPAELQANVDELGRLLDYNPQARVVWAHVGRDTTGHMRPDIVGDLLAAHDNLFIQIHPTYGPLRTQNTILDEHGVLRPTWLELLRAYPDRAVLGTDLFFAEDNDRPVQYVQSFLEQVGPDLAEKIGCINPTEIYRLPEGC